MKKNITDAYQSRNMIKRQLPVCSWHALKLCRGETGSYYRLVRVLPPATHCLQSSLYLLNLIPSLRLTP